MQDTHAPPPLTSLRATGAHFLRRLLSAAVVTIWALLVGTLRAHAQQPVEPAGQAVSSIVLLLAPGAALSDWMSEDVPDLHRLSGAALLGVVPTGPAQTSLEAACRALAYGTRAPGPNDRPLGDLLAASGVRVVAVANRNAPNDEAVRLVAGTGAAFANTPAAWRVPDAAAPDGVATDPRRLAGAIRAALSPGRRVLVVALFDDMARADRAAQLALPEAASVQRRDALRRLERLLGTLTSADRRRPDALLVVTPQPSFAAVRRGERLGPVLLWRQDSGENGLLTSPSTRLTPGLAANPDIAATVAGLLGLNPAGVGPGAGRVLEAAAAAPLPKGAGTANAYLARRVAAWAAQVREQRLLVAVPWLLAFALLLGAFCRRDARGQKAATALGLWTASVPLGLLLAAPLAPTGVKQAWVVYVLALGLSLAAPLLFWGFPRFGATRLLQSVAGLTTGALLLDPWLGAPLLGRSPLSYSVVEAARYYGMGNEAAGVFLGAGLVTAAALLFSRRTGFFAAVLLAVSVTATLALPRLGADFGGMIAALAGFGTLLFFPTPKAGRARRRGTLFAALILLAVVAAVVAWDAGRPTGERTHVGQAVANRGQGNGVDALQAIAARKTATAARLLVTSPWSLLLLAEMAVLFSARRERAAPLRQRRFAALVVAALAALMVNDSGVVAAAACLLYGAAARLTDEEKPGP